MGFCKPMSEEVPLINTKTISKEELDAQRENAAKVQAVLQSRYTDKPLACVITYGCQQNVADSEHIKGMLADMGYAFTDDRHKAQFILFNTCAVREHAEDRVFGNVGALKSYKAEHPDTVIALCGCMMQEPDEIEKIKTKYKFIDIVFGTHNIFKFAELVHTKLNSEGMIIDIWKDTNQIVEDLPDVRKYTFKSGVNIMYGCNNFCSYCIVPYVRGRERSRKPEEIVAEIKRLVADGVVEIMLLGQNVNSYGKNLEEPMTFAQLLREVNKIEGLKRIRFMTSHPKDLSEELIDAMCDCEKVCLHLHLPLQSGSSRILKLMNRRYTKEQYLDLVDRIRAKVPDVSLTTDIIVGFPGETEEDFLETRKFLEKVHFYEMHIFKYSRRKGTVADKMKEQVADTVKSERSAVLLALEKAQSLEYRKMYIGKKLEVLIEELTEIDGRSYYTGYTKNYIRVAIAADEFKDNPVNDIYECMADKLICDGVTILARYN